MSLYMLTKNTEFAWESILSGLKGSPQRELKGHWEVEGDPTEGIKGTLKIEPEGIPSGRREGN